MKLSFKEWIVAVSTVLFSGSNVLAQGYDRQENLEEVYVISSPKENVSLSKQPVSSTQLSESEIEKKHITSVKGLTNVVPNFFMPDYGSRLTSAIYIRGVGSRINNPAVGMYVDDIPYIDKSAFDFNFCDVDRIDVLRGPQGTLYGRNTMGGLIRVYTKNPFLHEGLDVKLGYATRDNHRYASLFGSRRLSSNFAISAGGYYEGGDGFFHHGVTNEKVDKMQAGGGRLRAIYLPSNGLKFDFTANYDYSDEDAYPYYYTGSLDSIEANPELKGKISANHRGNYRRGLLNVGLNTEYITKKWQMNAVTSYQNLNDRMLMDQDFILPDIYTLEQKQKINTLSEEISFRNILSPSSSSKLKWNWVAGINAMYQWLKTDAPVTFYDDGIKSMLEDNINSIFTGVRKTMPKMPAMAIDVTDKQFDVVGNMKTPTFSNALFHQSTLSIGDWNLVLGARLEYEKQKLNYFSGTDMSYDFNIPPMMNLAGLKVAPYFEGELSEDNIMFLPKFAVSYKSFYASMSKGYRSGGYNIQMFSDLVQAEMKNSMITTINEKSNGMMAKFVDVDAMKAVVDINSVSYEPEYSWNYEIGTHLKNKAHTLFLDAAMFYIRTSNQQIAKFAESGLGRRMVNAGKSESYGAELSLRYKNLLSFNYGYTHATFKDYDAGNKVDYSGNYVPFIPQHSFNLNAEYPFALNLKGNSLSLAIGADYSGTAKMYWTEANNAKQDFYGVLGAHARIDYKDISFTLWGKNLTDANYDTFYFESAKRGFVQKGKPVQFGADLKLHF